MSTNDAPVAPDSKGIFGPILRDVGKEIGGAARSGLSIVIAREIEELAGERNVPDRGDRTKPAVSKEAKPDTAAERTGTNATGGMPSWVPWAAGGAGVLVLVIVVAVIAAKD